MAIEKIPISFDYKGKNYTGYFSAVNGAAGKLWHLTINGRHWGQLFLTENFGWRFTSNQGTMEDMADYFGEYLMAWYQ